MLNARFFNAWAVALLVIGTVRFIMAWVFHQGLVAGMVQLVAGAIIACLLWLIGRSLDKPEFTHPTLRVWIVGLAIFLIAFGLTVFVVKLIF